MGVNNLLGENQMSTRACYTFTDWQGEFHVYKHHDGYPYAHGVHEGENYEVGGLVWINNAKEFAWELPRFEADDFAASFVVANKDGGGGCRLINKPNPWEFSSDSEYWYKIKIAVPALDVWVDVYRVDWWNKDNRTSDKIMSGALSELISSKHNQREVA
jgi:hypothetical protein